MIGSSPRWLGVGLVVAACWTSPVFAQTTAQAPAPAQSPTEEKPGQEQKPKTWLDEFKLFSYVEMGGTFNLHGASEGVPGSTSTGRTNNLREYDINEGYTFDMAEFSIKRDPDEKIPIGGGLVLAVGQDAQKNHSIGLFRKEEDQFPFRNETWFDLEEAYVTGRIPIGNGLVLKGGKFVSLIGYEVIESPNNLNYSRGLLFTLATPFTHTGALASYAFTDWLTAQAGLVLGWDRSDGGNDGPSGTGQISVTPIKDLSTNLNFIVGPEKSGDRNPIRWLVNLNGSYTGIPNLTLALDFDYAREQNDVFLSSQGLGDKDAEWYGLAGFVAYDFLKSFRAALRQEWFRDVQGVRTATVGGVNLLSTTATLQYNIWKGLFARIEYRHDHADEKVFGCRPNLGCEDKSQDTFSISAYYKFF